MPGKSDNEWGAALTGGGRRMNWRTAWESTLGCLGSGGGAGARPYSTLGHDATDCPRGLRFMTAMVKKKVGGGRGGQGRSLRLLRAARVGPPPPPPPKIP